MIEEFLLDEHLPKAWRRALVKRGVTCRIWRVGDPGAPPRASPDPDLLAWCETHSAALLTNNRSTMPGHLADHMAHGRHVPGIFIVEPRDITLDDLADHLQLLAGATHEGE